MRERRQMRSAIAPVVIAFALLLWSCGPQQSSAPPIPFAPLTDPSIKDPDNPTKIFRLDFARLEQLYPLTRSHLAAISPEGLGQLSQEELDQIYGRLAAGPMPEGAYRTEIFIARNSGMNERVEELLGGVTGRLAGSTVNALVATVGTIWKGKMFYREPRIARTFVGDLAPLRSLVDDVATVETATIPRRGLLRILFSNTRVWLLFPAKVYCGQSLLDARRESIIIDYNYAEDINGYRVSPDNLVGRAALRLRDEVRMIRPGFYLGRAYVGGAFLLNFTLQSEGQSTHETPGSETATAPVDECWSGEQDRSAAAR